jgi:hypothetical protein
LEKFEGYAQLYVLLIVHFEKLGTEYEFATRSKLDAFVSCMETKAARIANLGSNQIYSARFSFISCQYHYRIDVSCGVRDRIKE